MQKLIKILNILKLFNKKINKINFKKIYKNNLLILNLFFIFYFFHFEAIHYPLSFLLFWLRNSVVILLVF